MTNPVTDSIPVPVDVSGAGDHIIRAGEPGKWMRVFRIALTTSNTAPLTYIVPPGHYVLLSSTVSGTASVSIAAQTEEALG